MAGRLSNLALVEKMLRAQLASRDEEIATLGKAYRTLRGQITALEAMVLESTMNKNVVQCDCCGSVVPSDEASNVIAYGLETTACDRCRS